MKTRHRDVEHGPLDAGEADPTGASQRQAWDYLASLGADVALVQEAVPPPFTDPATWSVHSHPPALDQPPGDVGGRSPDPEALAASMVSCVAVDDDELSWKLSDHCPVVAEFEV